MSTSENDSGVDKNKTNDAESSSADSRSEAELIEPDSERTIAIRIGPDIQWGDTDTSTSTDSGTGSAGNADAATPHKQSESKPDTKSDSNPDPKPAADSGDPAQQAEDGPREQPVSQPAASQTEKIEKTEKTEKAEKTEQTGKPQPEAGSGQQAQKQQQPAQEKREQGEDIQVTQAVDDPSIPALGDIDQVTEDPGPQIGSFDTDTATEQTRELTRKPRRAGLRASESSAQQKDYVRKIEAAKEAVRRAVRLDENALDQSIAETRTLVAPEVPPVPGSGEADEQSVPSKDKGDSTPSPRANEATKVADRKTEPVTPPAQASGAAKKRKKDKKAGAKDKKARKLARKQAKKQAREQARLARQQQNEKQQKIETGGRKVTIVSPEAIPDTTRDTIPETSRAAGGPAADTAVTDPLTANLDEAVTRVATQQDVTRILQRHADSPNIDAGSIRVLSFTGNGFEYFKLWIVNTFLSLITLGVYSAWAKVKLRKYLYRHTHLLNNNFDYAGDPLAILKGRVLFAVCAGLAAYLATTHWITQVVLAVIAMAVFPWLLIKVRAFNARNTSFSNVHFSFDDTRYGQAAVVHIIGMLITVLTLGLMAPSYWYRQKKFLATSYRYGSSRFEFSARVSDFYRIFFIMISLVIGFIMGFFVLMVMAKIAVPDAVIESSKSTTSLWSLKGLAIAYAVCCLFFLKILYDTETSKLFWYSLSIRNNHFGLLIKLGRMTALYFINVLLTLLSFGLYYPWAKISLTRYKVGQLTIVVSPDVMTAIKKEQINAARKTRETPKFFGHEIGL